MARGTHSLLQLYRRMQGLPDREGRTYHAGDLRELAEFLHRFADEQGGKGAPEAMTILGLLAIDARHEGFLRWLLYPGGGDNRFLDERDRAQIEGFVAYAAQVRAGATAGLGTHGSISKEKYLAQRGLADVDGFVRRGCKFLGAARMDPRAPAIIRTLGGAFVPMGLDRALDGRPAAPLVPAAVLVAAVAALAIGLWPDRTTAGNATADSAFAADLGAGPRVVLGWRDGRWRIVRPGGALEWEAPPGLRLPELVEGGAAGDLTGDGVPELALFSSVPLEVFDRHQTGAWIFTRDGDGWRLLDRVVDFVDGGDPTRCAALRDRLAAGGELTAELHRERQRCPSRIGQLAIRGGALHVVQLHYGRQYLRARCDAGGCGPLTRVLSADADVTSAAFVDDAAGRGAIAMGTGCWNRFAPTAYGVLVRRADGADAFTSTGGRTAVAAIDRRRLAVFAGAPCDGAFQQAMVAAVGGAPPIAVRQRMLAIAEIAGDGHLRFVDQAGLAACCGEGNTVAVLAAGGRPTRLAIWYREREADDSPGHVWLYDLGRPLAGQSPQALPGVASGLGARLAAIDVDGDGTDELVVAGVKRGTEVWAVGEHAPRRLPW